MLLVVFTVPLWLRLTGQLDMASRTALTTGLADVALADYLLLAACGVGWPIAERLRILRAERVTIEGCHHHPHLERPDALASPLQRFLRAVNEPVTEPEPGQ